MPRLYESFIFSQINKCIAVLSDCRQLPCRLLIIYKYILYVLVAGKYKLLLLAKSRFDGFVSFVAKTKLIEHYQQTLGAQLFGGQTMIIYTNEANILVDKYFKN